AGPSASPDTDLQGRKVRKAAQRNLCCSRFDRCIPLKLWHLATSPHRTENTAGCGRESSFCGCPGFQEFVRAARHVMAFDGTVGNLDDGFGERWYGANDSRRNGVAGEARAGCACNRQFCGGYTETNEV